MGCQAEGLLKMRSDEDYVRGLERERDMWHRLADERSAEIVRLKHWEEAYTEDTRALQRERDEAKAEARGYEAERDEAIQERDAIERINSQLHVDLDELRAELRKYEPSDGVMHRELAFIEAIREAAGLLVNLTAFAHQFPGSTPEAIRTGAKAWLALPVVKAVKR